MRAPALGSCLGVIEEGEEEDEVEGKEEEEVEEKEEEDDDDS